MIKTEVMDVVTQISQNQIQNIEKTFDSIDGTFETLKQNMSSEQSFDQIAQTIPPNLEQLDKQIKEMKKMMSDVKLKWFAALDKQHYAQTLNDKITKKLDKVNEVQGQLGVLIDEITDEIEHKDVDDVLGESACMFIQ